MVGQVLSGHRGLALALLVTGSALGIQYRLQSDVHGRYDRFDLPAFDAHVYLSMAEEPAFFTVAPWGYRVLAPSIVHVLPVRGLGRGFRYLTLMTLGLAGALLFVFFRRLGHGEGASLLAVAAFGFSGPVSEVIQNPFLAEPLTLLLVVSFLLAIEAGAGVSVLSLIATLGALSKEFFLLLLPLVYLATRKRAGDGRALARMAAVALPATAATLVLRLWWTPYLEARFPEPGADLPGLVIDRFARSWDQWWRPALLGGLTPVAALGCLRRRAWAFLRRYGYLLLAAFFPPFFNPVAFFAEDIPRLLLYALPALLPLCLLALDRIWPHLGSPRRPWRPHAALTAAAAVASLASVALPPLSLDRYRRADLRGVRDGPLVRAFTRESIRTARRLQAGRPVTWDPDQYRFVWGRSDPHELPTMRWFLGEGWGPLAHYQTGDILMEGPEAFLVLPSLEPRDQDLVLSLSAAGKTWLRVEVNGGRLADLRVESQPRDYTVRVPASALFRGDNWVSLVQVAGVTLRPRLHQITIRPLAAKG